ncbi:MAG: HNH endonuclease, partial [Nitrosopumilaceae archaeon]|nr:HNH endonuclease [Nitrosopumilaceae archaeon]
PTGRMLARAAPNCPISYPQHLEYERPRFHTIRGKKRNVFYDSDDKKITLRPEALVFLHNYHAPLLKMIFLEWTIFLEKANPMMPKLSAKIARNMDDSGRAPTNKQKRMLSACEESKKCFYCDKSTEGDNVQTHYDPFIPWSFLHDTEIWNLVVSCQTCNASKSDMLAPESCMVKLLARNEKYPKLVKDLGGEWKNEIKQYDVCGHYGFGMWDGAKDTIPQQQLI